MVVAVDHQAQLGEPPIGRGLIERVFRLFLPALSATNTLPRTVKRLIFLLADIRADRILAAPINQIRNELGLPPVHRIFAEWWCSPDRVIGLFPPWFGPPQPDWPEQTRLTGFLRYDEGADTPVSTDIGEKEDEWFHRPMGCVAGHFRYFRSTTALLS